MKEKGKDLSIEEKIVADQVADEILTVEEDGDRRYFFLLLVFFICLIFLVSTVSFAIFDTYRNGTGSNAIDVGVDVDIDDVCTKNCDTDGDGVCDKYCDETSTTPSAKVNSVTPQDEQTTPAKTEENPTPVNAGTILFSYNEGANYIDMINVAPTSDQVGMQLSGNKQYFDFNVSVAFEKETVPVTYEVTAVPNDDNTLSAGDVRTYLTEEGSSVSILSNQVNDFNDLPDSTITNNGKVLYKKIVTEDNNTGYIFRMWLSGQANLNEKSKKFGCKIIINGYYDE